jgi:predicted O-methyltransferase YrrM
VDLTGLRRAVHTRVPILRGMPIDARPVEPSLIAPPDRLPSDRLIDLALRAVDSARSTDLRWLAERAGYERPNVWPGEHYRLLSGLVATLRPTTVVEIGTATGLSALAMKAALPKSGKLVTFDVVPWRKFPAVPGVGAVALSDEDFADGRLEQRIDDLSIPEGWRRQSHILREADFVFIDAKHDGEQERAFLQAFDEIGFTRGPIVAFDDIRLWKLLAVWRDIARPKLDLTSFGHWSGTGLADYA